MSNEPVISSVTQLTAEYISYWCHHLPVDPPDGGPGPVGEVHGHDVHLGAVAPPQLIAETLLYREINLHRDTIIAL